MRSAAELLALERRGMVSARRTAAFDGADALFGARFDADNGRVPQLALARRYAERWEEMAACCAGLLFWGGPGTGKTFAAACIANALVERLADVRFTTLGRVLNTLPGLSGEAKRAYLDGLTGCDLLILDDFGMERRTEYAQEQIFGVVDGRWLSRRPLIVTTNLSLDELKHPAGMAEQRLYDRILERCAPVCFSGESQRRAGAAETLERVRRLLG